VTVAQSERAIALTSGRWIALTRSNTHFKQQRATVAVSVRIVAGQYTSRRRCGPVHGGVICCRSPSLWSTSFFDECALDSATVTSPSGGRSRETCRTLNLDHRWRGQHRSASPLVCVSPRKGHPFPRSKINEGAQKKTRNQPQKRRGGRPPPRGRKAKKWGDGPTERREEAPPPQKTKPHTTRTPAEKKKKNTHLQQLCDRELLRMVNHEQSNYCKNLGGLSAANHQPLHDSVIQGALQQRAQPRSRLIHHRLPVDVQCRRLKKV